jgi:hypothetical protein
MKQGMAKRKSSSQWWELGRGRASIRFPSVAWTSRSKVHWQQIEKKCQSGVSLVKAWIWKVSVLTRSVRQSGRLYSASVVSDCFIFKRFLVRLIAWCARRFWRKWRTYISWCANGWQKGKSKEKRKKDKYRGKPPIRLSTYTSKKVRMSSGSTWR